MPERDAGTQYSWDQPGSKARRSREGCYRLRMPKDFRSHQRGNGQGEIPEDTMGMFGRRWRSNGNWVKSGVEQSRKGMHVQVIMDDWKGLLFW